MQQIQGNVFTSVFVRWTASTSDALSLSFVSLTVVLILNCLLEASHRQLARNFVAWFSFRDASLRGQHSCWLSPSGLLASCLQQFCNENFNPPYWLATILTSAHY